MSSQRCRGAVSSSEWFAHWTAALVERPKSRLERIRVAADKDDFGVVYEQVDHRGGDYFVAEDFTPRLATFGR